MFSTARYRRSLLIIVTVVIATLSLAGGLIGTQTAEAKPSGAEAGCTHYVSPKGKDKGKGNSKNRAFATIQYALNVATKPGNTICVLKGEYHAPISFPGSGSEAGYITLRNFPGDRPVLTGANAPGDARLVDINNRSYVRFQGFEVKDWVSTTQLNAGVIIVQGAGSHIEIRDNVIHDINGEYLEVDGEVISYGNTRPIAIWGSSLDAPLRNVVVTENVVYRTTTVDAENIHIWGNIDGFELSNNDVHDAGGFFYGIGGGLLPPEFGCARVQPQNGIVKGNLGYQTVFDRISSQPGIYLDAAKNITIDSNTIHNTSYGIFITAEQYCGPEFNVINEDIVIQNNLVYGNRTAGVWIGSPYRENGVVQVDGAIVRNNTIVQNGTEWKAGADGGPEGNFGIGAARNVEVYSNIFADADYRALRYFAEPYENITLDHNLYYSFVDQYDTTAAETATFQYAGETYTGFDAYRAATGQDANSIFARPVFTDIYARDFSLAPGSPGVDAGSPVFGQFAPAAFDATTRPRGAAPDVGAYER